MNILRNRGIVSAALILTPTLFFLAQPVDAQEHDIILVTPQGQILDSVPEMGEVTLQFDRQGRRVLVNRYGEVVAYEMPANRQYRDTREERRFDPDRGWGYGRPNWGSETEQGAITGTTPSQKRLNRDIPVTRQPLPEAPETANLEPETGQPEAAPEVEPDRTVQDQPAAPAKPKLSRDLVTALQVFLDREGFSPGVIDGRMGSNVEKALVAWEAASGETLDISNPDAILQRLSLDGGLPFRKYEITAADAAGPYVAEIPSDYAQKATLPALSYTSTSEKLAEQFHMDEDYLKAINPGVDFSIPGTEIKVVNPGENRHAEVTRIVANKRVKQVEAFDKDGNLIAAYPATIGSSDTPSPSGTVTVERIALDPNYTYNPKINFQQGENKSVLTIPPGPNGPVGDVWIALSKPTYGIHGTPEPSKIGKTASHGCVRLTNWDARELAKMVKPGVIVQFVD